MSANLFMLIYIFFPIEKQELTGHIILNFIKKAKLRVSQGSRTLQDI